MNFKETTIFDGEKGFVYNNETFRLSCGAVICEAPNNDLLCVWLTGTNGEPAPDNCAVYSRSVDGGKSWSSPEMLVPPAEENGSAWIINGDGKLILLYARWPNEAQYTVWRFFRAESYDNGYTWVNHSPVKFVDDFDADGMPFSASFGQRIRLSNGKYLCCGTTFHKRKQPLRAGGERLAFAKTEQEALDMGDRIAGETHCGKFGTHLHGCAIFETDADLTEFKMIAEVKNRPLGLLEPTMLELKDGTLVMLMRAEWGGYVWRTDSHDGGYTWCDAYQTDIKDPVSMSQLMRLKDGRIALLHNDNGGIVGETLNPKKRDPLSLWISDDELESFCEKYDMSQGGSLAYPNAIVRSNGEFVLVYDRNRRETRFIEVKF